MARCYKGGNQHKFKPRYTEEKTGFYPDKFKGSASAINELRTFMIMEKYVCDVCEWCGKVVNKQEEKENV